MSRRFAALILAVVAATGLLASPAGTTVAATATSTGRLGPLLVGKVPLVSLVERKVDHSAPHSPLSSSRHPS